MISECMDIKKCSVRGDGGCIVCMLYVCILQLLYNRWRDPQEEGSRALDKGKFALG